MLKENIRIARREIKSTLNMSKTVRKRSVTLASQAEQHLVNLGQWPEAVLWRKAHENNTEP